MVAKDQHQLRQAYTHTLLLAGRQWRRLADAAAEAHGISEARALPLVLIGRLGGAPRQNALAEAVGIEGPSLVRLLDSLERRGFIERREDENDRRARGIHLTRAGRDLAVRAARIGNSLQKRLLDSVPANDLEICERVLETLEREIEERPEAAEESPKRRKR